MLAPIVAGRLAAGRLAAGLRAVEIARLVVDRRTVVVEELPEEPQGFCLLVRTELVLDQVERDFGLKEALRRQGTQRKIDLKVQHYLMATCEVQIEYELREYRSCLIENELAML